MAHIADEDLLYNGYPLSSVRSAGAKKLGMENLRSLVGRGVLLELCALRGVTPLPKGAGHCLIAGAMMVKLQGQRISESAQQA